MRSRSRSSWPLYDGLPSITWAWCVPFSRVMSPWAGKVNADEIDVFCIFGSAWMSVPMGMLGIFLPPYMKKMALSGV